MLLAIEWAFFLLIALAALGGGVALFISAALTPIALNRKQRSGEWPPWAGRLGATLAISGTIVVLVGAWAGYVATL